MTLIPNLTFSELRDFHWALTTSGMLAGNAYPSGHMVSFFCFGLPFALIVETHLFSKPANNFLTWFYFEYPTVHFRFAEHSQGSSYVRMIENFKSRFMPYTEPCQEYYLTYTSTTNKAWELPANCPRYCPCFWMNRENVVIFLTLLLNRNRTHQNYVLSS